MLRDLRLPSERGLTVRPPTLRDYLHKGAGGSVVGNHEGMNQLSLMTGSDRGTKRTVKQQFLEEMLAAVPGPLPAQRDGVGSGTRERWW